MSHNPIRGIPIRKTVLHGILIALVTLVIAGEAAAQTAPIAPVPLRSGYEPYQFAPAGTVPPLAIAPAPRFSPGPPVYHSAPVIILDGRPVFVAPPQYAVPATAARLAPAPLLPPPPQPVPITANLAPTDPGFHAAAAPPVRRPSAPANLQLVIGEVFLNRVLSQERIEPGPVNDVILGAQVTGRQTTVSRLRADLLPASDNARIALVLNGDVQTLTTGVTPQAMINTAGQQQFFAVKEVYFDAIKFSTRHATVFIRAHNQTVGAMTPLSGTLFGGLADRIAYQAAERRKSASEAVARDRLADRLFPTFDGEVDAQLARANQFLEPARRRLESFKLLPDSQSVWTTDSHLNYELLLGEASQTTPNPVVDAPQGVRLSIHDSLLNTLIDRTALKGYKTTDKKLRALEETLLEAAGGTRSERDDSASPLPALPGRDEFETEIVFDEHEPLKFKLERDRLVVTLKAQFKPAGQEIVPPMVVTVPYQAKLNGNKVRYEAGTPTVFAQDRSDPSAPQTIMEMAIQKVIQTDLIPIEFDRALPAALWKGSGPPPRIASIESDDRGWLHIVVE